MSVLCGQRIGGQLGCILPGGHEGSHDIGPVLRRRVVIKPVVKLLAPRPLGPDYPPPPLGPVAPVRVGDTVELELVEDEALNEAFWAPARITSIGLQGAFSAKIYAPGSVWHAWTEKGYLPKAEGVEWRRAAPRVLRFTHGTDLSSTLLRRVQAAARRQQARVTGSVTRPVAAPLRKAVKKPKLSKLHGRLLVKLRLHVAGSGVLATVSPREVPRPWTAAEDASLVQVLRGLAQRGTGNIMHTNVWQEAVLQLASVTGMPARSVYAVQQRYLGLKKAQQLVHATVSVSSGRVALALKPRAGLPVLPQRRHSAAQQVHQLRSELNTSKRALSQAQTDIKELRANVERLRAENARLDAENVALLVAQDGSAAHITASVGVKKRRPGDDAKCQEEGEEQEEVEKEEGSVKYLKKKKVQFQMPTQTKLMKMTEQMESESENENENEMKSEDEEARTLLHHPMLEPQQTEHARKIELNHQRRKNGRGSTPNSQLKLEAKTSLNLIPANIQQPSIAPRSGAFYPIPSSDGTPGAEVPPIVQRSKASHHFQSSDGMPGTVHDSQQPDAK